MLEMKFILSIVYLISFLALANAADGAVSSSLRGSNNYPTLAAVWAADESDGSGVAVGRSIEDFWNADRRVCNDNCPEGDEGYKCHIDCIIYYNCLVHCKQFGGYDSPENVFGCRNTHCPTKPSAWPTSVDDRTEDWRRRRRRTQDSCLRALIKRKFELEIQVYQPKC